jgi:ATP-binding cassette subfamily C (CFTR/MRP) protein 4
LKLSNKAVGESTVGQMVNLLSNDVSRFERFTSYLHYLWLAPLQFSLIVYLSWQSIGNATFVGGCLLLLFVPFQSWIGKKFSQLRSKTAKKTDIRIRIMNEIIKGIKVIKMYAWETSFSNLVANARKEEIEIVQTTCLFKAICDIFFFVSIPIVIGFVFNAYVSMGNVLTAEKAFLTLTLYSMVKIPLLWKFPAAVKMLTETLISIRRIQEFLLLEEVIKTTSSNSIQETCINNVGFLKLKQVSGKWSGQCEKNTLNGISFEANCGQLIAIVGPVGSGKGSILQAILGNYFQACCKWGKGFCVPSIFGRSVNPISTKVGHYPHPVPCAPLPGFSDLATALICHDI